MRVLKYWLPCVLLVLLLSAQATLAQSGPPPAGAVAPLGIELGALVSTRADLAEVRPTVAAPEPAEGAAAAREVGAEAGSAAFRALAAAAVPVAAPQVGAPAEVEAAPVDPAPSAVPDAPAEAEAAPVDPAPTAVPEALPEAAPAEVEPQPPPAKGKLIVIDPGHGGGQIGSANGDVVEKHLNLDVSLRLAEMLRSDGYDVKLTREDDRALGASLAADLQARVDIANQAGADILVSVHHNGSPNAAQRGTMVLVCNDRPFAAQSNRLAQAVLEGLVRNLGALGYETVNQGIVDDRIRGHLALLAPANLARPSRMPAIIGEALYVSHDSDAAMLRRDDMREAIARGYFEGIKAYFGDAG